VCFACLLQVRNSHPTRRGEAERCDSTLNFVVPVRIASEQRRKFDDQAHCLFVYQPRRGGDIALLAVKFSLAPRSPDVTFLSDRATPLVAALATWGLECLVDESGCNTG